MNLEKFHNMEVIQPVILCCDLGLWVLVKSDVTVYFDVYFRKTFAACLLLQVN